ncbi:MAG: DNA-3-methyladenine glycosylase 2 family protein [Flavobacteriaceae bacterium]|nr:DNA-3-methyladenine glycosylase 2 family protein [Flavobacteriaceae bacterium]
MKSYKEILQYLEKDIVLHEAIQKLDIEVKPEFNIDVYFALLQSIVSQQLSTKVARIIFNRLTDLFVDGYPKAEQLLITEHKVLRSIGLSNNKVNYVKNVAEFSLQNNITFDYLLLKTDNEIIEYLTQIKGVGKWTVQMILMFPMDRPNVFPVDDLGIQNGMKDLYQVNLEKKELKLKLIEIAQKWHPYKTLASKYIWKIGD